MLHLLLILNFIFHIVGAKEYDADPLGVNLVGKLKNDANLDLPEDQEYEDLRAEFLAYHTALASLSESGRRSMISTPCWKLGGICVNHNLCTGFSSLSQVPGCKDKLKVCCFVWNRYNVRDYKDKGIGTLQFPWSVQAVFGGKGVIPNIPEPKKRRKSKSKNGKQDGEMKHNIAIVIYQ